MTTRINLKASLVTIRFQYMKNEFEFEAIILNTKNLEINYKFKHLFCSFMQSHKKLSIFWNNLFIHSWIKCIWCFYTIVVIKIKNHCHCKTCIFALPFILTIINILIQVIFPNIITYLDKAFKKKQNDINFKTK